ncbi:MAG: hypothetical protein SVY41_02090 [Candidatus Nanohaloarchaea archaeon]|nr:hypothetical protein [Candidatus Nanohaloarchaea archaeon]
MPVAVVVDACHIVLERCQHLPDLDGAGFTAFQRRLEICRTVEHLNYLGGSPSVILDFKFVVSDISPEVVS